MTLQTTYKSAAFLRAVGLAVWAGAERQMSTPSTGAPHTAVRVVKAAALTAYSTTRALFVTAVASYLCNANRRHRLVYWYYILPWYLLNKNGVADQTLGRLLGSLTDDPTLLGLFADHAQVRRRERCAAGEKRAISQLELAHWGGCLACQYWLSGRDAFERDHDEHVRLAAALHVLDDYLDQEEDLTLGAYNYFVNHPAPADLQHWIDQTLRSRRHFRATGQLHIVRLIDGSLTFYGLANTTLFQAFYGHRPAATERPDFVSPHVFVRWRRLFAQVF